MKEKTISVAMAVYNGEKYISEQIDSIIKQLGPNDEIVISYNTSHDNTWNIIVKYSKLDKRITCIKNKEKGVLANFENAIKKCTGDIICLSDQDDIWVNTKVRDIKELFKNASKMLLLHNCGYINKDGIHTEGNMFEYRNAKKGIFKNLIINSYQGCCMAFTKDLVPLFLPIPRSVPMHDQWMGILAELYGNVILTNKELIYFRRRDDNTSGKKIGILKKINGIIHLVWNVFILKRKKKELF